MTISHCDSCAPWSTRETDGIAAKLSRCGIASEALWRNMPLSTQATSPVLEYTENEFGTWSAPATQVAKRHGEVSESLIFRGTRGRKTAQVLKNYDGTKIQWNRFERRRIFSPEGSFGLSEPLSIRLCWVGAASGPFLEHEFFPLKLGLRRVFVNVFKRPQKWLQTVLRGTQVVEHGSQPTVYPLWTRFGTLTKTHLKRTSEGGWNFAEKGSEAVPTQHNPTIQF